MSIKSSFIRARKNILKRSRRKRAISNLLVPILLQAPWQLSHHTFFSINLGTFFLQYTKKPHTVAQKQESQRRRASSSLCHTSSFLFFSQCWTKLVVETLACLDGDKSWISQSSQLVFFWVFRCTPLGGNSPSTPPITHWTTSRNTGTRVRGRVWW